MAILHWIAAFGFSFLLSSFTPVSAAELPSRLLPGDYRLEGAGLFRRLIVTKKAVSYEIWQAAEGGKLQHLTFSLTSPGPTPTESDAYRAYSSGKACGTISLHFYRGDGKIYREFLVFGNHRLEQALSSGGRALSAADFENDKREVAALARVAGNPAFYGTLDVLAVAHIHQDVPKCS